MKESVKISLLFNIVLLSSFPANPTHDIRSYGTNNASVNFAVPVVRHNTMVIKYVFPPSL